MGEGRKIKRIPRDKPKTTGRPIKTVKISSTSMSTSTILNIFADEDEVTEVIKPPLTYGRGWKAVK